MKKNEELEMGQEIKLPNGAYLKELDNGNIEIRLKKKRLSFFHGFDPQERRDDKTKELVGYNYNTAVLLNKTADKDEIDLIKKGMSLAKGSTWGDSGPRIPADRMCLRDGEPMDPETVDENVPGSGTRVPLYDGYAGCLFLAANRTVKVEDQEAIKRGDKARPVKIIGPKKGPDGKFRILKESDEFAPYSGCYANVVIRIYGFKSEDFPARINASLEAVQFAAHGEAFANKGVDVDDAFDEEDVGEDEVGGAGATGAGAVDEFDIG